MIAALRERIASALRERRILRLCRQAIRHAKRGNGIESRVAFLRMSAEIGRRTPAQVARMERVRGLERRRHG